MLDRAVIEEFLDDEFEDLELEIPDDIDKEALAEAFCQYVEDDYYEWLKDNFKSFFEHGNPDWDGIKERIDHYTKEQTHEELRHCQSLLGYRRPAGDKGREPV